MRANLPQGLQRGLPSENWGYNEPTGRRLFTISNSLPAYGGDTMPIEIPERDPCPFCRNLEGEVAADEERTKRFAYVERRSQAVAIVNPYQVSPGALLVMTTRHAPTVLDLVEDEALALARLVRRVAHAVHGALSPVGLNIYQNNGVASGQTIPHYHVHVVPRYMGDRPELLLAENAKFIPYEERVKLSRRIAARLPR